MTVPIYFVAGKRTPFVKAGTVFATPLTMSAVVMKAMNSEKGPDFVVWGQVIPRSTYTNIAREAWLDADLEASVPAFSTQMACSTSMIAAIQAAGMIATGNSNIALVGGVEQMGRFPLAFTDEAAARLMAIAQNDPADLPRAMAKLTFSDTNILRGRGGNRISGRSMGDHTEETAKILSIPREQQDQIAYDSHMNASAAQNRGFFDDLITPFGSVEQDSFVRSDTTLERLAALKSVFDPEEGTLTAGNSSPLTDGAAGLWVASEAGRQDLGEDRPALRLVDWELSAVHFGDDGMLMAPAYAIPRLLARQDIRFDDVDVWEIREAFAAQVLANIVVASDPALRRKYADVDAELGAFPWDRLNPNGSSLALGHPFAATGARILSQTAKELHNRPSGTKAVVSVCADGGLGTVALLERP